MLSFKLFFVILSANAFFFPFAFSLKKCGTSGDRLWLCWNVAIAPSQMLNPYRDRRRRYRFPASSRGVGYRVYRLPFGDAAHLSILVGGVGIVGEIIAQPIAALCHQIV
jgi:hypothetical protein